MAQGDLILMGPPGSGKGTQAKMLAARKGWAQLSTGELFRDHERRDTALGKLAREHTERGAYVPDEVTVGMVRERLSEIPESTRIVFDGFPRTVAQSDSLDELLGESGRRVERVLLLEVPSEELVTRLMGRGRSDDRPEVIRKRLEVYEGQTRPVLEHYRTRGLLRQVSGLGTPEDIAARVNAEVG